VIPLTILNEIKKEKQMLKLILFIATALISLNVNADSKTTIEYGNLTSVLITTPDSKVLQNAIVGGVIGLAVGQNLGGVIDGAAYGYGITSIIEGDRRVFLYTINVKGKEVKVVMEDGGLSEGQCVAIETTKNHTNLRAVSTSFCLNPQHKALSASDVVSQQQSQAKACDTARKIVLTAKTDADIDHAMAKVRALCE